MKDLIFLLCITNWSTAHKMNELRMFWKQAIVGSSPGSTTSYHHDLGQVLSDLSALGFSSVKWIGYYVVSSGFAGKAE